MIDYTDKEILATLQSKVETLESENKDLRSDVYTIKDSGRTRVVRMAEEEMQSVLRRLDVLEAENRNLQQQVSQIDTAEVEFVDIGEEEIEIEEETPEEKSTLARQALADAMGARIVVASASDKDDLKKINGIGPFIEDKLNEVGIYTYEQISQFDEDLIQKVTDAIQFFPGRIERDDWVGQAKTLFGGS